MKELLREKLLETRRDFENLENKEKCKCFMLEVDLCFDKSQNVVIKFIKIYENENGEYDTFAEEEFVETNDSNVGIFIELLRYAEDRYGVQFTYAVNPLIHYLYGNVMDTEKFKRVIGAYEDKTAINDKLGFAIIETIF